MPKKRPLRIYSEAILPLFLLLCCSISHANCALPEKTEGLALYYYREPHLNNFGDCLSLELVKRIVQSPVKVYQKKTATPGPKLLAIGSILFFANQHDVIWGSGTNGKKPYKSDYTFDTLDIRAVRGPLTRSFLMHTLHVSCPEIYGDPALLLPYFFPEFRKKKEPSLDYLIIPHYSENKAFPKNNDPHIVYTTEPWEVVLRKILDSKFVISSSLHGIIVAEAYGIPARWLRVSESEPLIKYQDYYAATNRPHYRPATSVEEALALGGEPPFQCDLRRLYEAFPFEYWPNTPFKTSDELNLPKSK